MRNKEEPLVSVAMVTYNSESYVRMAIDSVLTSSYQNFELIISDDSSKDNTWSIIGEYSDPRIRVYRNEVNIGEYVNRNKCIDLAKGKYFLFIDGDDIILPHGLETYVRYAESYDNFGMVIQKGYFNDLVFPIILEKIEIFYWEFNRQSLLNSSFTSNFFITEVLKAEGKLSTKFKSGDSEIRHRLALKYPVLFIPGWLTWPRETPGQASSKLNDGTGQLESIKMYTKLLEIETSSELKEVFEGQMNRTRRILARFALKYLLKFDLKSFKFISKTAPMTFGQMLLHCFRKKYSVKTDNKKYSAAKPLVDFDKMRKFKDVK